MLKISATANNPITCAVALDFFFRNFDCMDFDMENIDETISL